MIVSVQHVNYFFRLKIGTDCQSLLWFSGMSEFIFVVNNFKRIIPMEDTFQEIFPELQTKLSPEVYSPSLSDLEHNSYFHHLVDLIRNQYGQTDSKTKKKMAQTPYSLKQIQQFDDVRGIINKIIPKCTAVQVPRGTIIYTVGAAPDEGYFLIHGCVELLAKKNSWERLQSFNGHTIFNVEDRVDYLQNNFHISPKHFEVLEPLFYEDKMTFNFLPSLKLFSGEYFGFKELVRGCLRTKMAIALEDSLLVKIKKQQFDRNLKQFEQKREQYIINCMFQGIRQEVIEDTLSKIPVVFNSSQIIKFDRDEEIFREGQLINGLYFILNGEVQQSKDVKIEVPKKFLSNENLKDVVKEVTVKLHKLVKNSFVGEIEPLMSMKTREFTCVATLNETILLKLDSATFLKSVGESPLYERELSFSVKHKYSVASDTFLKQKSEIIKSYFNQFQQFDHKKKEKNISAMLNSDANFKLNGLYQLFKKEGVFYRDTFQRLEGFQQFQAKYDPKRASINRHKIKSTNEEPQSNGKSIKREARQTQQRSPTEEADLSFEATKKLLMSPGKSGSPFETFGSEFSQKFSPISEHTSSSIVKRKRKNAPKFQQLQKDQTVFKRVLIKNGRFEIPRETNKSNRIEAIVNHKFDEVVRQCMTRKNIALRKAIVDNRQDLIKEEFRKTLTSMPKKSVSMTRLGNNSTCFGYTCKGTEEMRKKLQKLKWSKISPSSPGERAIDDPRLQECIGFNQQPLSSEIKHRSAMSSTKMSFHRSPQKIVLLNHMMKPITYTSSQI